MAYLVVAFAHRLVAALDRFAGFASQIAVVERRLELCLEVVLAALDLVDDGLLVAARHRGGGAPAREDPRRPAGARWRAGGRSREGARCRCSRPNPHSR